MVLIPRSLILGALLLALAGCGAGEPAPAAQPAAAADTAALPGEGDAAEEAGEGEAAGEWQSLPDTAAIFVWTPAQGNRRVATMPGDVFAPMSSRVVPGGVLVWRYRGDAGDYYMTEPWVVPFDGGPGRSLGEPDVYFATELAWLPGDAGVLKGRGKTLELLDPRTFAPVRTLTLPVDSAAFLLGLAVGADGRVAVTVGRDDEWERGTNRVGTMDLLVLRADGTVLARFERVSPLFTAELGYQFAEPTWLPDGRILLLGDTATRPHIEGHDPGEGADYDGIGRRLLVVDVARGAVEPTDVVTESVALAARPALLELDEGRFYDLVARAYHPLPAAEGISPWSAAFSPDGAWVIGARNGAFGVLRIADDRWYELGDGYIIGWGPEGELYWTTAKGW